eukprot:ctg_709.g194
MLVLGAIGAWVGAGGSFMSTPVLIAGIGMDPLVCDPVPAQPRAAGRLRGLAGWRSASRLVHLHPVSEPSGAQVSLAGHFSVRDVVRDARRLCRQRLRGGRAGDSGTVGVVRLDAVTYGSCVPQLHVPSTGVVRTRCVHSGRIHILSVRALPRGRRVRYRSSPDRSRTASACRKEYPHPLCLSATLIRPERALAQADIPWWVTTASAAESVAPSLPSVL